MNPFQIQYKNGFLNRSISKPLISKGSMLLGKTNMFSGIRQSQSGNVLQQPFLSKSKQSSVLTRPYPVNTPQPLVPTMVKESSLREIFNESYFQDLFEFSTPMSSPTAGVAPIGGVAPMQHHRAFKIQRPPTMGAKTLRQHIHEPGKTPVHLHQSTMGMLPARYRSGM